MFSIRQVFHLGAVLYYGYITQWLIDIMLNRNQVEDTDPVIISSRLFGLRYLSSWAFLLQGFYFFIAFLEEIVLLIGGIEKTKEKFNKFKDYVFTTLAAPMAMMVSTLFWTFYFVDRELVYPAVLDQILSSWYNHSIHTGTSALVLLEMYLCFHKYPTLRAGLLGIAYFLLCNSFCVFGTYFQRGVWLYPGLVNIGWPLRISIVIPVYILTVAIYGAGFFLNKVIWNNQSVVKKSPLKKN